MPELPEVETTRRGISPHLKNQHIRKVLIKDYRLRWPVSEELPALLDGKTVKTVERRAKYLLIGFDHGYLIIHLGMSGSLRICGEREPLLKHDHIVMYFGQTQSLRYNDPRRFGCVLWTSNNPFEHKLLDKLGPEPFDPKFNADYLFKHSRTRKIAVKSFVMNSQLVVGVGNIYANEALFLSGVRPRTAANRLTRKQYGRLAENIVLVLNRAIEKGGTTLRDFVGGDGKPGYFQQTLNVYGRAGEPCRTCSTGIKQITVGQRSTFYCPSCQR